RVTSCRIRQKEVSFGINIVEQRLFAAVEIYAAHGYGDDLGSAGLQRAGVLLKRFVFPGAHDQPRAELASCNYQRIRHSAIVMKTENGCGSQPPTLLQHPWRQAFP